MRGLLRSAAARVPLLAVLALCATHPTRASAQTTGTTTTTSSNQAIDSNFVVRRNGGIVPNGTLVYGNIEDCGGDPSATGGLGGTPNTFEFSATFTANVPIVEVWLGVGSSENCATQANRLRPSNNAQLPPVCTFLGTDTSNTRNPKITVPGNMVFNQTSGAANPADATGLQNARNNPCDSVTGGQTYTIYFLPLQTPTTNVNGSDPITVGVLSTLKAVFTPYTRRPAAPSNLTGQSGETQIGVSFKAPASSMTLTKYKAYFDVTGGSGAGGSSGGTGGGTPAGAGMDAGIDAGLATGEMDSGTDGALTSNPTVITGATADAGTAAVTCGSGYLVPGQIAPANPPAGDVLNSGKPQTATSLKLTSGLSNVPTGTFVAAAAVSIDPAGNESVLSEVICIEHVNTTGFIDACNNTPGCREGFHACSLSPGRSASPWALGLLGLAVAALARRRRRA